MNKEIILKDISSGALGSKSVDRKNSARKFRRLRFLSRQHDLINVSYLMT